MKILYLNLPNSFHLKTNLLMCINEIVLITIPITLMLAISKLEIIYTSFCCNVSTTKLCFKGDVNSDTMEYIKHGNFWTIKVIFLKVHTFGIEMSQCFFYSTTFHQNLIFFFEKIVSNHISPFLLITVNNVNLGNKIQADARKLCLKVMIGHYSRIVFFFLSYTVSFANLTKNVHFFSFYKK